MVIHFVAHRHATAGPSVAARSVGLSACSGSGFGDSSGREGSTYGTVAALVWSNWVMHGLRFEWAAWSAVPWRLRRCAGGSSIGPLGTK